MKHTRWILAAVAFSLFLPSFVSAQFLPPARVDFLSGELGFNIPNTTELEIGTKYAGTVTDPKRLQALKTQGMPWLSKNELIKVKFLSETKVVLTFPSDQMKAVVRFEEQNGQMKAILDWLGSLEAPE